MPASPPLPTLPERLRAGRALGGWCTFRSFACAELMAHVGYDFLVFDLQHGELALSDFPALLGALNGTGVHPVVRVPQNDPHAIHACLDLGASGAIVPSVDGVDDARRAVAAAKYPPLGRRSFGPYRSSGYGRDVAGATARADRDTALILQLESAAAVKAAPEIAALPGVDAVMMGPNDLAFSLLGPGQSVLDATAPCAGAAGGAVNFTTFARTPRVLALCADALAAARGAGKPFGMTAGTVAEAREWFDRGAAFATCGSDWGLLRAAALRHLEG